MIDKRINKNVKISSSTMAKIIDGKMVALPILEKIYLFTIIPLNAAKESYYHRILYFRLFCGYVRCDYKKEPAGSVCQIICE